MLTDEQTSRDGDQARTRFDWIKHRFDLMLPSSSKLTTSGLEASFASDLLHLFNRVMAAVPVVTDESEWADVVIHSSTTGQSQELLLEDRVQREAVDSLPDIGTIERPEELVKKPPYWLIVRQEGRNRVMIEGSHGPSLSVLEVYLKKWCRSENSRVDRVGRVF